MSSKKPRPASLPPPEPVTRVPRAPTKPRSARWKEPSPTAGPVHVEAYLLWSKGETFSALAKRFGKHIGTMTYWARQERWRETFAEAQAKAQQVVLETQVDDLTRIGLRHRRGARALQRFARKLLDEGTLIVNPETGAVAFGKDGKPLMRTIGPHELQATTGAFVKAADLEYGRAGGKTAAAGMEHTFPDLVDLLERVWKERQGPGAAPLAALPPPQADPRRRASAP